MSFTRAARQALADQRAFRQSWRRMLVWQYLDMVPSSSVQAIADRFGVSHRCVQMDLCALRKQGEKIEWSPAPGGGVSLR